MSANDESIPFHVRLPNRLFWDFVDAAKMEVGETRGSRSIVIRRLIRDFVKKKKTRGESVSH